MAFLCCTSDFGGDGNVTFVDTRLYHLWAAFVNKLDPVQDQLDQMGLLYASLYFNSTPETAVERPELDCADFDGDFLLDFVDVRFIRVWTAFVNQLDPVPDQLDQMGLLYASLYFNSTPETAIRIPAVLDPANCEALHGWFVTPWHQEIEVVTEEFGWLE